MRYRTAAQEWSDEYNELHAIPGERGPVRLSRAAASILTVLRPLPWDGAAHVYIHSSTSPSATLTWGPDADGFIVGHAHGASSTGFPRGDAQRILTAFRAMRGRGRTRSKATFRVQVHALGESGWTSNALSFESPEEAKRYGSDLFGRWYGIDAWRVLDGAGHVRHQEGDFGRSRTRRRSGRRSRLGVLRIG